MRIPEGVARLGDGHEERFQVDDSTVEFLAPAQEKATPRRFKMVAYTGKAVTRAFGWMVVNSAGLKRGERMGMLLEHDDHKPVAVADKGEPTKAGAYNLEGYFLDDVASAGEAGRLVARYDQGWPLKASIGIRFRKHTFVEEGVEVEVNGRQFKGPIVVVDEADLFETSFIHVNPADLDTEASVMKQQERTMADQAQAPTEQEKQTLREQDLANAREEGAKAALAQLERDNKRREAILRAVPGESEKAQKRREALFKQGASMARIERIRADRLEKQIQRDKDKDASLRDLGKRFGNAAPGIDASKAEVVQAAGQEDRFVGLKWDDRVYAELRQKPQLMDVFQAGRYDARMVSESNVSPDARKVVEYWLRARDRKCTRDGSPVLCDLLGGAKGRVSPQTLKSLQEMAKDVEVGFQAQRLDAGSSGPDLSLTTVNGFQGMFYTSYEEELSKNWSLELSYPIPSDQQIEIVRWLGPPPMIQEWKGPRIAKNLPIYEQLLKAVKFEGTLDVDRFDWDHQKWDLIAKSFGLFGAVASQHWDIRFTQLLENNPNAYDGFPLYSGQHTLGGDSGTIQNDYTSSGSGGTGAASRLAVADPTMPTQLEWANIILQLTPKFRSWAWANGIKMNGTARQWCIMCHPDFEGNLQAAISSERLDLGASNPLFGQRSQYVVKPNPYITIKKYIYIFRMDTQNRALLRAEPDPIEMLWQGPGSHRAFDEDKYSMGLRCVRSIAPGAFESTLRATVGAA